MLIRQREGSGRLGIAYWATAELSQAYQAADCHDHCDNVFGLLSLALSCCRHYGLLPRICASFASSSTVARGLSPPHLQQDVTIWPGRRCSADFGDDTFGKIRPWEPSLAVVEFRKFLCPI